MAPDRPISCQEALSAVYDYLDGELEGLSPEAVEEHFRICVGCYPHLLCEKAFKDALQRAAGGQRAPEGVRERILRALEAEDGT